ncbi:MAG: hypothetical protein HY566_03820 [Candidatus Kerfeldbacteria bacterium]|nr:hypothetical protein [Candidatus Kerfeldbacteria bacterium]
MALPSELAAERLPSPGTREEDFASYWKILAAPVVLTFAAVLYWNSRTETLGFWRETVLEAAMFLVLTALAAHYRHFDRRHIVILNVLAGVILGLALAVSRLIVDGKFYLIFNIIAEPVNVAILGVLIGWVFSRFAVRIDASTIPNSLRFLQRFVPHKR